MRILLALLLGVSLPLAAQSPYLVKDINTTISTETESSKPIGFTLFHDRLYFVATTKAEGAELWSANPGGGDAKLVADIIPGQGSSSPTSLKVINGVLLFSARDVNHGIELWVSDGTTAGTHLFVDLNPGPNSTNPFFGPILGNRALFVADDGIAGRELWSTDGTVAGTHLVKDIAPGSASSSVAYFTPFNGVVYFSAASALWKTDGTDAGTIKVADVFTRMLTTAAGKLYFQGATTGNGYELWTSDGTDAGTHIVADIRPGPMPSFDSWSATPFALVSGNRIVFAADDGVHGRELWVSDGTAAGTGLLREFKEGAAGAWDGSYFTTAVLNGRAYFEAEDAGHGREVWVTDGTDAGTKLFADLVPGANSSYPWVFTVAGQNVYFLANIDSDYYSNALLVTNGIAAPRRVGADQHVGVSSSFALLQGVGDKLYFAGIDELSGSEPWVTDGTDAGTKMIANIARDKAPSSFPAGLTAAGNLLYFWAAENGNDRTFWRTDGTSSGTFELVVPRDNDRFNDPIVGGPLVFLWNTYEGPEVMSNGTREGTESAQPFLQRFGGKRFTELYTFDDALYATIDEDTFNRNALWKTTAERTAPATPLGVSGVYGLIDVAGQPVFHAGSGLWATDGTPAGTRAIVPEFGDGQVGAQLVNAAGTVYYLWEPRNESPVLWKSDGTFDGTVPVASIAMDSLYSVRMTASGQRVFLLTNKALWVSDGTQAGTVELAKVDDPYGDAEEPIAVGNGIVFTERAGNGWGLWTSDGTTAGTKLLRTFSYTQPKLTNIDGKVWFQGYDAEHGFEIWTTDGTDAGTKLWIDLEPGTGSSSPYEFTKVGNTLYFTAYTDNTGTELWALPLTNAQLSIRDTRMVEGESALRFNVTLNAASTQNVTVDYATSNGTATAGQDYDSANGTLTFAAGETTKTIDVHVHADAAPENNETVFVTLRNASGATILDALGAGIVEDDDQAVDLRIAVDFTSSSFGLDERLQVTNDGPRSATGVDVDAMSTPFHREVCQYGPDCSVMQVSPGGTKTTYLTGATGSSAQSYVSATVSARERDLNPANNTVHWTIDKSGYLAMDKAFLHPGETATVSGVHYLVSPLMPSSDPSVLSISPLTVVNDHLVTATVTALKAGTSIVSIGNANLLVTVVPAGTAPRWANAVSAAFGTSATTLDRPLQVIISPTGTALFTGARPTGTVTVTASGRELARAALHGATLHIPVYFPNPGSFDCEVAYSGDANFEPKTFHATQYVYPGHVSITDSFERVAGSNGSFALTLKVEGSPIVAPTGHVSVVHNGVQIAFLPLVASANGISIATTTLTNLPESPTLTVNYVGDPYYDSSSQQIRLIESRHRSSRH
jgi:ELWxxDGT repeat protein